MLLLACRACSPAALGVAAGRQQRQLLCAACLDLLVCLPHACVPAGLPIALLRPAVHPGMAYALATRYGSLGGLMDVLLDPSR
jgi:hypothetical protein